ncbi:PREDICTED: uncharacterized protein LOC103610703 [Galeopterus variegatus]|uniref:Uncharacterized protein LOC103610703 n=1 Tax=Galeopterus variegatus TaxID=482537 RepID=A0ABM0SJJ6_GALVR|nr:PREDICTED: uncharacterized protein LOC103610703 [Galeopterus variegatus]
MTAGGNVTRKCPKERSSQKSNSWGDPWAQLNPHPDQPDLRSCCVLRLQRPGHSPESLPVEFVPNRLQSERGLCNQRLVNPTVITRGAPFDPVCFGVNQESTQYPSWDSVARASLEPLPSRQAATRHPSGLPLSVTAAEGFPDPTRMRAPCHTMALASDTFCAGEAFRKLLGLGDHAVRCEDPPGGEQAPLPRCGVQRETQAKRQLGALVLLSGMCSSGAKAELFETITRNPSPKQCSVPLVSLSPRTSR